MSGEPMAEGQIGRMHWQIAPWSGELLVGFSEGRATAWREPRSEEVSKIVLNLYRGRGVYRDSRKEEVPDER